MSNPQGPSHNPADPPAWGQQPVGGWGKPEPEGGAPDDERTQAVDPRTWAAGGAPPPVQQPAGNQPFHGGQAYGNQAHGGPQPTQQYPGGQQYPGQQPGGQQYPGQPGWPPAQGQRPQRPQPAQQYPGGGMGLGGNPPLPPVAARSGRSKLPWILSGVGALVVAAILVLGFVAPGFFVSKVFDTAAVQAGVQKILTDSYDIRDVSAVTCGEKIAVTAGDTFTCDATIAGSPARIPVRITSADGDYEVGRPA